MWTPASSTAICRASLGPGPATFESVRWDESHPGGLQPESAPRLFQAGLAADGGEEAHLPAFLGLTGNHRKFMDWLVGKPSSLSYLQVLAHATLLPTKALQWGLNHLYSSAPGFLGCLAERLIAAITPKQ
jgi:hypothetical protein